MQRIRIILLAFIAITTVLLACKKEPVQKATTTPETTGWAKEGGADCVRNVRVVCGMLAFNDRAHFDEVYACLQAAHDAHLDAFEALWGYLSEDDYNDMADQLGFVDEQPLIEFEVALSHSSYRRWIGDEEDAFLAGGGHPANSPQAQNLFDDEVLETMYNMHAAVMIGSVIHYRAPDGTTIEFCSCELFEQYLSDPSSVDLNDPCISVPKTLFCSSACDCCKSTQVDSGTDEYAENRLIRWTLRFEYERFWEWPINGWFYNHRSCAKIIHYKKRNGTWKKRRADLYAKTYGQYSDTNIDTGSLCKEPGPYSKHKAKRRKVLEATNWYPAPYYVKTFRTGEAKGYWEYPNNNYLTKMLEFPC